MKNFTKICAVSAISLAFLVTAACGDDETTGETTTSTTGPGGSTGGNGMTSDDSPTKESCSEKLDSGICPRAEATINSVARIEPIQPRGNMGLPYESK